MLYNQRRLISSFLLGAWIYSLLLWAWIGLNYYLLPEYQYGPISIYIPIPQNLLADIAFPASFAFFVLWHYFRNSS